MKLTQELKEKIDAYFDNISPEKLYELAVLKYGFTEITVDIENTSFEVIKQSFYSTSERSTFNNSDKISNCLLSSAA